MVVVGSSAVGAVGASCHQHLEYSMILGQFYSFVSTPPCLLIRIAIGSEPLFLAYRNLSYLPHSRQKPSLVTVPPKTQSRQLNFAGALYRTQVL